MLSENKRQNNKTIEKVKMSQKETFNFGRERHIQALISCMVMLENMLNKRLF